MTGRPAHASTAGVVQEPGSLEWSASSAGFAGAIGPGEGPEGAVEALSDLMKSVRIIEVAQ